MTPNKQVHKAFLFNCEMQKLVGQKTLLSRLVENRRLSASNFIIGR